MLWAWLKYGMLHQCCQVLSHLHKVVYSLEVGQVVVLKVDADTEEQAGIAPVDNLEVAELEGRRGGEGRREEGRGDGRRRRRGRRGEGRGGGRGAVMGRYNQWL